MSTGTGLYSGSQVWSSYALTGYYLSDTQFPKDHPNAYGRRHWTRVTQIVFDPLDTTIVWAVMEIDCTWRSTDGGEHWESCSEDMMSQDIHGFAVIHNGTRSLYATTNAGLNVNEDNGANWTMTPIALDW